ncbi:hypothetical protein PQS31_09780 [Luteimonas sp BLCC-B24]|uniref:hypothetical protein n=1 Tax=Luteimonas sp. BLCC-B24 TaxID=3025317 RepID=UPI00234CB034|nr:hypothetical protein [Luteimonas sp. BLCC-B24]MDC7807109.1 hypothetical protein [Luteimonas sp. BLCC-B24]
MPIQLYRGDTRTPEQIQAANGFAARAPLTPATAIALVNRCMGQAGPYAAVALPPPANTTPLQTALNSANRINLLALMAEIKKGKSQDTVHISTDVTPDAGGYGTSYVYRMTFTLNYQVNGQGAVIPVGNNSDVLASAVGTRLVFEGANLATSQLIALTGVGAVGLTEVAFLTSIPYAHITHYQAPGTTAWVAMP